MERVHVHLCFNKLNDQQKKMVVSYIVNQAKNEGLNLQIPSKFRHHYKLVGANPGRMSKEEHEELMKDPMPFIEGKLYDAKEH